MIHTIVLCPNVALVLKSWWEILKLFMAGSDLSLNLAKSFVIGINLSKEEVDAWADDGFNCQCESLPINYLAFF